MRCFLFPSSDDRPRKDGVSTEIREVRDRVRQLIWKATDVVVQAVDDMPRMEVRWHTERLANAVVVVLSVSFDLPLLVTSSRY